MLYLTEILLISLITLVSLVIYLLNQLKSNGNNQLGRDINMKFERLEKDMIKLENLNKEEFYRNREESSKNAKDAREEMTSAIGSLQSQINRDLQMNREELTNALKFFEQRFTSNVKEFNDIQKEKFSELVEKQNQLVLSTEQKLEKMRETVDEKLHKTLEERLGESFKLVSERLELVHKGLGEMQNLATGVGDLKKVLSNVKTRGVLGEIQLENILEQILTQDQYDKNVITKKGSKDYVEFAIKLPGKEDLEDIVYLPLDSKFPLEVYHQLLEAYDSGDSGLIEEAGKRLESSIKKSAKDIRDKYIDPPNTTDFGVMFLPIEGLYAEVVRRTGLIEVLQRDFKINITGPTTLAALLNSLHMGFRTLAIEKRSSEVWMTLAAVKVEFDKFGNVLNKAQEKINQASKEIDMLVGTRTKQIQRKLKNIESIGLDEAAICLDDINID
ncbi:DNA recombination protein RmuC [Serpentinicella alkaliphila]|uniref:DNA recombination protein RmuC n=1 Tax=Serpentinicella alkaliphila TaxID=1734049 RepID=A0A4R2TZ71_9FIRM|nr:DNA recombination protein RmuC [Serpentinicella alkaliphila]QUH25398.1 DNA recombination protein RmuC [Serpentinicella alkaliphila]TCQ00603.1 DNA recombination protein RmuC [Serpentinicella alkaliphila]